MRDRIEIDGVLYEAVAQSERTRRLTDREWHTRMPLGYPTRMPDRKRDAEIWDPDGDFLDGGLFAMMAGNDRRRENILYAGYGPVDGKEGSGEILTRTFPANRSPQCTRVFHQLVHALANLDDRREVMSVIRKCQFR